MLKAYKYQLYPTDEQRESFNLGIVATSIYYNMILEFWVTAFKMHEGGYLSLKSSEDKSKFLDVIKAIAEKRDKNEQLIIHNQWARELVNDTEYHRSLFCMRNGTPKKNWVDIAEACATYAIMYHRKQFEEGLTDSLHPIATFERGAMQMAREAVKNAIKKYWTTRTKTEPFKGFPKFKSRKNPNNSYTYSVNFKVNFDYDNRVMKYVSKKWNVGDIKIGKGRIPPPRWFRAKKEDIIPSGQCEYKSFTISRSPTNKYYISVLVDDGIAIPEPKDPDNVLGIDIGLKDKYCALSDETIIEAPKALKQQLNKLTHLQRDAARKLRRNDKGKPLPLKEQSKNYFKAIDKVKKLHEKISNIRTNFLHTLTSELSNSDVDAFSVETLSVKDMMIKDDQKLNNAQMNAINRAYSDAAIFTFIMQLEYKCKWKGKRLIKVDKYFASSQLCSCCGFKNTEVKDLSIREWTCPECSTRHDRDINAAINIRQEGLRILKT